MSDSTESPLLKKCTMIDGSSEFALMSMNANTRPQQKVNGSCTKLPCISANNVDDTKIAKPSENGLRIPIAIPRKANSSARAGMIATTRKYKRMFG